MKITGIIIVVLAICLSFAPSACAETIILKSGKTVEGKIIKKTDQYIQIDFPAAPLTYFLNEIETIDGQKIALGAKEAVAVSLDKGREAGEISEQASPDEILKKVVAAYGLMQTYKAKGTVISDIDTGGMKMTTTTDFSILLKKPNLYLISWTQKNASIPGMVQAGAVWSDGTQPYLYMGAMNAYSKMSNDLSALSGATGISGGAAFTIPSIFLSVFKDTPNSIDQLLNAQLEKTEQIEGQDCYVISGSSKVSKKVTFWISKSKYLIVKYSSSLEAPEGGRAVPEMTDEQLEEAIKGMGQQVTAENKQKMREMVNKSRDALKNLNMKGSFTEVHLQISSPALSKADFQFALPQGTVLRESLFDGSFGRRN